MDRRTFLGSMSWSAAAAAAVAAGIASPRALAAASEAGRAVKAPPGVPPDVVARDESFWWHVQQAFTLDRSIVNLNHGGVSPAPAVVQEAMRRHLELSNTAPAYVLWQLLEPRKETVREGVAAIFGCDPEEVALTRNASESLQILQCGLPLGQGDEVLTTDQDYPRMLTTFRQRERRDGIVLKTVPIPVPCEDGAEIVRRLEAGLTGRTRMILVSHVINLTGQVMPVREIAALGKARGIPVIVDGAHAFAHLDVPRDALGCDFYGVSLHKWLFAPHGTGFLYVRRERIPEVWPLTAAEATLDGDIRKFEEIGTHPAANMLAASEAIAFHHAIGPQNKLARMRYLRERWAAPLRDLDGVRFHSSFDPAFSCGIGTVQVDGVEVEALHEHLWKKHRIFTTIIKHPQFTGLRITPSVSTTLDEIDRFVAEMTKVAKNGLPA